jgi:acetyl-CoA synthetase (ADP-forming)
MSVLADIRSGDQTVFTEYEAKEVLKEYGIPVQDGGLATTKAEARDIAEEIGYPVVMKGMSKQILHKSDAGIIELSIEDPAGIEEAFDRIMENAEAYDPDAEMDGVLVNPMAPEGTEVIIGINRDPQFGPVVMFGLGGIFVEILEDVSFRVAPIDEQEATEMMEEIQGYPLLTGARGEEPRDLEALVDIIVKVSELAEDLPIEELDLNPVFAYSDGALAIDARMIVSE